MKSSLNLDKVTAKTVPASQPPKAKTKKKKKVRIKAKTPRLPPPTDEELEAQVFQLRGKVTKLCRKFQQLEFHEREEKHEKEDVADQIQKLEDLLEKAKHAKIEAFEYTSHGRVQLVNEIKRLTLILHEAKQDVEQKESKIETLAKRQDVLKQQNTLLNNRLALERHYFSKLLEEERRRYGEKLQDMHVKLANQLQSSRTDGEESNDRKQRFEEEEHGYGVEQEEASNLEGKEAMSEELDHLRQVKKQLEVAYCERYSLLSHSLNGSREPSASSSQEFNASKLSSNLGEDTEEIDSEELCKVLSGSVDQDEPVSFFGNESTGSQSRSKKTEEDKNLDEQDIDEEYEETKTEPFRSSEDVAEYLERSILSTGLLNDDSSYLEGTSADVSLGTVTTNEPPSESTDEEKQSYSSQHEGKTDDFETKTLEDNVDIEQSNEKNVKEDSQDVEAAESGQVPEAEEEAEEEVEEESEEVSEESESESEEESEESESDGGHSLPDGWERVWSKSKQRHYYFCYKDGASVWRYSDIPKE